MSPLWVVPASLIVDQVTKLVVMQTMMRNQSISVLGDVFRLTYIHNSGAAFGLNLGSPALHTLVSIVALAALAWLFRTSPAENRVMRVSLCLILGGALGNIVDRLRLSEVVDFLDFGIGTLRWPVFNVADSCVTVGIVLLALSYSRQDRKQAEARRDDSSPPEEQVVGG
ncbi:MAG: signal peptidase II [Candidatus Latescibacterota bacterium]